MSRNAIARLVLVPLASLGFACSGGEDPADGGLDAGVNDTGAIAGDSGSTDTGPADTGTPPMDAGMPDSGFDDNNDSIEEAFDARKNTDNGFRGALANPGDRDFYYFEGAEGEFVRVYTISTASADGSRVDTVLRIRDADENQLAENDDAVPRISVDSELIYRLPAAGRYYVEVLEWSDWAGETPTGAPNFTYTLQVRTVNDRNPGITIETEAGNDAASAIPIALNNGGGLVCGTFSDAADVDVYAFTQPSDGRMYIEMMPAGTNGHGGSAAGSVWMTDATTDAVVARLDLSGETTNFSPAAPPGDYLLWVQHPGTAASSNDFYAYKPLTLTDNDPEVEPNDQRATADARVLEVRDAQMDRANFVLATLPGSDVDYFSVTPAANETISVVCGSATAGSGVQGLTVELQDSSGAVLATATEPADDLARIMDTTVTSSVVYIRLSKTGQDPVVTSTFVRCGIFANM